MFTNCEKSVRIRSFSGPYFPAFVFGQNLGKHRPEKLQIRTLFTQCTLKYVPYDEARFLALGYHCYFMNGNGVTSGGIPDMQIFQGVTKNSNECVIRCIGNIQESPDINGVTFAKSKRQCFCKIKMVKIAVSQDHETCFLSSK